MKKGFTIIEVSILFVIFLIVALLVAPMSLDDTRQIKFTSKWRNVQSDFANIFYTVNAQKNDEDFDFNKTFLSVLNDDIKSDVKPYKITYMNGTFPSRSYRFENYKLSKLDSVMAVNLYDTPQENLLGVFMYDVNGANGPNVWGKDVFGFNIYKDKFEPFCKEQPVNIQNQDCSKDGTGLCCSNYYLIGGSFD